MQRSKKRNAKSNVAPNNLEKGPPVHDVNTTSWYKDEIIQLLHAFAHESLRRKVINIYTAFCKQNTNFIKEVAQAVATGKKCTQKITPYFVRKHSTLRFEALALDQKLYWIKRTLKTIEIEES